MSGQLSKRNGNGLRRTFPFPAAFGDIDDIFNRMWRANLDWDREALQGPSMDLSETEEAYRAVLELPGVDSDDIDIQISGNRLTISGKREEEKKEEHRKYHRTERSYGSFSRSVTLPCEVAEEEVSAILEGGVLTVDLPKAAEAKPSRVKVESA